MKYIFSFFKRLVLSFFILYGFNIIGSNFNIIIPINIVTVLIIALLGFPALLMLLLLYLIVY